MQSRGGVAVSPTGPLRSTQEWQLFCFINQNPEQPLQFIFPHIWGFSLKLLHAMAWTVRQTWTLVRSPAVMNPERVTSALFLSGCFIALANNLRQPWVSVSSYFYSGHVQIPEKHLLCRREWGKTCPACMTGPAQMGSITFLTTDLKMWAVTSSLISCKPWHKSSHAFVLSVVSTLWKGHWDSIMH